MLKGSSPKSEDAEVIALRALGFLASDGERLERFMALSGLTLPAIRQQAGDPAFLAGVLDHVLGDQSLLLMFAEAEDLRPEQVERCRARLPGGAS